MRSYLGESRRGLVAQRFVCDTDLTVQLQIDVQCKFFIVQSFLNNVEVLPISIFYFYHAKIQTAVTQSQQLTEEHSGALRDKRDVRRLSTHQINTNVTLSMSDVRQLTDNWQLLTPLRSVFLSLLFQTC